MGNIKDADIILTQACSDLPGGVTSETNKQIAGIAAHYAQQLKIPVLPQHEVGVWLLKLGIKPIATTPAQGHSDPLRGEYINTRDVALLQKTYCDRHGYKRPLLVQYVPHFWRCLWCYKELGMTGIVVPPRLPPMEYQKGLEQKWLGSPWTLYLFEFAARLVFFRRGWI